PALLYLFRVPTFVAVGTSLLQILVTMTAATLFHAASNQSVDIVLAVLLITGGVFGAQFGARAGRNLRGESFRMLLALLLLAVGFRFASQAIVKPNELFSITIQGQR
ncbi:MAG: TSUP family transporter, partial [Bosea sp. (in: a-proteobacteria)]